MKTTLIAVVATFFAASAMAKTAPSYPAGDLCASKMTSLKSMPRVTVDGVQYRLNVVQAKYVESDKPVYAGARATSGSNISGKACVSIDRKNAMSIITEQGTKFLVIENSRRDDVKIPIVASN